MLGAATPKGVVQDIDVNTLTSPGCYRIYTGCTNLPSISTGYAEGSLNVYVSVNGSVIIQEYHIANQENALFIRKYWYGSWSSWSRIDNFGCDTPSALAELLGAIGKQKTVNTDTDCNTLTLTGLYYFGTSGSSKTNKEWFFYSSCSTRQLLL